MLFVLQNWLEDFVHSWFWLLTKKKTSLYHGTLINHRNLLQDIIVYFLFRIIGNEWTMANYTPAA